MDSPSVRSDSLTTEQLLRTAIEYHQAGRLSEAEPIYRRILEADPRNADALHLLGLILLQHGQADEAIDLINRSLAIQPGNSSAHCNLANALCQKGRFDDAITASREAIRLNPRSLEAYANLGFALQAKGQIKDAIAVFRDAVALNPNLAKSHLNLGNALRAAGEYDQSIAASREALRLNPDYAEAHNNLGIVLQETGKIDEAIAAFTRAVALRPEIFESQLNLGNALQSNGKPDEAAAAFANAVKLEPNNTPALTNLAFALASLGRLDEALAACTRAIEIDPKNAGLRNTRGNILKDMGLVNESIAEYRQATDLAKPEDAAAFEGNLLYALHFDPNYTPHKLLEEHRAWARKYCDPLRSSIRSFSNDQNPDRRLRIGYVSPDFCGHPISRFLRPLIANHDHQNFEIFCYASVSNPDLYTKWISQNVDVWRDVLRSTDAELAEQIRADGIDILVDLTMHMADNRLLVFARKPAPVQATWLAYAGTTGLETIDYRITDPYLDPPGGEEPYTEKSVRIPSYWCYEAPNESLPTAPPPVEQAGFVTLGCLNNFAKVTQEALQTWMRILAELPGSRLLLHAAMGAHRNRVQQACAAAGIDPGRVEFVGKLPFMSYMQHYNRIDIALDPFPYVGGTTTCDALWMGVPVVTLRGQSAISRGGVSILTTIGMPELIADSTDQYAEISLDLARDPSRLRDPRFSLRDKMLASPLTDARRFAADIESAYRSMWRTWCNVFPAPGTPGEG